MQAQTNGIGLGTILALIFMTLKLTGDITWSWWWVFAPIWIPLSLVLLIMLCVFVVFLSVDLLDGVIRS
jgi:uncharacterized membrane protein YhdT